MTTATFSLLALSFISLPLVSSEPVNKGKGRSAEIAYGAAIDYAIVKTSYPFMARIILDGSFKCGGALISDRFVATARHCLEFCPCFNEANPSNDWTRCNKLCILKLRENSDFISDTETVHIIKTIHLPENSGDPYKTRGQRTDFALIELAESANTCTQEETAQDRCWPVTPVRLPDPSIYIKEGQKVRTLGWGATELSIEDEQSEFLAQLDIFVNSSTLFHFLIETNIGPNGADPCKGDSGGPLLLRGDDLEWTLVGTLVGGGYACDNPEGKDTSSDWNKVNLHVPWITSVVGTTTVDIPVTSVTTVDKPVFPRYLTLRGDADNPKSHYFGLYRRTKGTEQNGRPVWKLRTAAQFHIVHILRNQYLFCTGNNFWMFGDDYTIDAGYIVSGSNGYFSIPRTGWKYAPGDGGDWKEDPSMRVTIE